MTSNEDVSDENDLAIGVRHSVLFRVFHCNPSSVWIIGMFLFSDGAESVTLSLP